MDGVVVKIDKKDKSYSLLLEYIREKLGFPKLKSFELFDSPDTFYVIFKRDGRIEREKFLLDDFTSKLKGQFINFYNKCLTDPRYKSNFWNAFVKENFDIIREEVFLYFKNIFPEANFNLLSNNLVCVSFDENLGLDNIDLQINPKQINLHATDVLDLVCNNYIENILDVLTKKIKNLNDTSEQKEKTQTINSCVNDIIEKINENKTFKDWKLFSNYLISRNHEFKENINLLKLIDSSTFSKEEEFIYKKLDIKTFKFSYSSDYVDGLVERIINYFKDRNIERIYNLPSLEIIDEITEEYNKNANKLFCGCREDTKPTKCYVVFPDVDTIFVKGDLLEGHIKNNKLKAIFSDDYKKVTEIASSKKAMSCINYFYELANKYNLKVDFLSGNGILLGETSIKITEKDLSRSLKIKVEMPLFKDSITNWKKVLKNYLIKAKSDILSSYEKEVKEATRKYSDILGMFLPRDILRLIHANKTYITENIIASALKSKADRSSFHINYTENCGKYTLYKSGEIKEVLDNLVSLRLVSKKRRSSDYGEYYTFHIANDYSIINKVYAPPIKDVYKKISKILSSDIALSDDECVVFFKDFIKHKTHELKDYIYLLNLIKNKSFLCFYNNEFIEAFIGCPGEVISFITMKKKTEESLDIRRIYKKIIDKNKI